MRLSLEPQKASRELGRRLAWVLHTGTLRDVLDELALPTWPATPPPFPVKPTSAPLSVFDSSSWDGTLLLGAVATTAHVPVPLRLALFAVLLARGANPFARGSDGRPVDWVLQGAEPEVRSWCERELQVARERARRMERYEIPVDVKQWIAAELASLDSKADEAEGDSAMLEGESVEPKELAARPIKRTRSPSPLPDYEDEPPSKRAPEESSIAAFRTAQEQQRDRALAAEVAARIEAYMRLHPPGPPIAAHSTAAPRPSGLPGLSAHDSHVFMPLVQTLRAVQQYPNPVLNSQIGAELRSRFPDVYTRDQQIRSFKVYSTRAAELGIVTSGKGAKLGREWIRLTDRYLHDVPPDATQPASSHAAQVPHPSLPPPPRTAAPPGTASRQPPPPPPPLTYIPPEATAAPDRSRSLSAAPVADRAPASSSAGQQFRAAAPAVEATTLPALTVPLAGRPPVLVPPATTVEPAPGAAPAPSVAPASVSVGPAGPYAGTAPRALPPAAKEEIFVLDEIARFRATTAAPSTSRVSPHLFGGQGGRSAAAAPASTAPQVNAAALPSSIVPSSQPTPTPSATRLTSDSPAPPDSGQYNKPLKTRLQVNLLERLKRGSPKPPAANAPSAQAVPAAGAAIGASPQVNPLGHQPSPRTVDLRALLKKTSAPLSPRAGAASAAAGVAAPATAATLEHKRSAPNSSAPTPSRSVSRLPSLARPPPVPAAHLLRPLAAGSASSASRAAPSPPAPPAPSAPPALAARTVPTAPRASTADAALPPAASTAAATVARESAPPAAPSSSAVGAPPLASGARAPRGAATQVRFVLHRLPSYATALVLREYLLRGPSVFARAGEADFEQLDELVRAGKFRGKIDSADALVPPIPRRQEVLVDKRGYGRVEYTARVVYGSRKDADRARAIFDGRRIVEGPAGAGEAGVVWQEEEAGSDGRRAEETQRGR